MSYNPNIWNTGDIITAEKLNNMERGIGESGGGETFLINVEISAETGAISADKTYAEIIAAVDQGIIPVVKFIPDETEFFYYTFCGLLDYNYIYQNPEYPDGCIMCIFIGYSVFQGQNTLVCNLTGLSAGPDGTWGYIATH